MTNKNQIQRSKQNELVTKVAVRVQEMVENDQINIPSNYSIVNAVQAAYFKLTEVDFKKKTALIDTATPESVAFALQDMAIQALSVAKNQGYFIVYGDKMQFVRSYHGTQAVIKRMNGVKDIWANVVWKGEKLKVAYNSRGRLAFESHEVDWKAATGKKEDIEGAYCIIELDNKEQVILTMTIDEILTSWSQSSMTSVQNKYPQEMAKRTVINRAAKAFINTSDDSDLFISSVNRTTENEYERKDITPEEEAQQQIAANANQEEIDIEQPQQYEQEVIDPEPTPKPAAAQNKQADYDAAKQASQEELFGDVAEPAF